MSPSLSVIVFTAALLPAFASIHLHRSAFIAARLAGCLLTYASLVGFGVAIVALNYYASGTVGALGKSADGHIAWWSWVLLWPYHLGLRVKLTAGGMLSSEPLYTKIATGWWASWASMGGQVMMPHPAA